MKKIFIVFLAVFLASFIFAACGPASSVSYCPYCSSASITALSDGYYQCGSSNCGKKFGAKEL